MNEEIQHKSIAFLPWLELPESIQAGNVRFAPYKIDFPTPEFIDLAPSLKTILSSYRDIKGKSIGSCTLAFLEHKKPGADLSEQDQRGIQKAIAFLYLASFAKNSYCCRTGSYVNSALFQLYIQRFSNSQYFGFVIPRRDGLITDSGYTHGELYFTRPLQCSYNFKITVDDKFLDALINADANNSSLIRRLLPILPFVRLANMDDNTPQEFELILMGAAFEQILNATGAYKFQEKLGMLFQYYGSVKVESVLSIRPGIKLASKPECEFAQRQWFIHKKWAEELHNLRSALIHGENLKMRAWGWNVLEHLLMAAFVFPLLVKLYLALEGHYALTEDDHHQCAAIDQILSTTDWFNTSEDSHLSNWMRILNDIKYARLMNHAGEQLEEWIRNNSELHQQE